MKKTIATGAALRRALRNEEPAPEPGVEASVFSDDAKTLGAVLAMTPDEFQRWKTFARARRAVGDD